MHNFINEKRITTLLRDARPPDTSRLRDIIAKAETITTLSFEDVAALLSVTDATHWEEMADAAGRIKRAVYDNRIVTFAPLYVSNRCVNDCAYCGFRAKNTAQKRCHLTPQEVQEEAAVLAGKIGHKRVIAVYGEHPTTDVSYIAETMQAIYRVREPARKGWGNIRRINVNAAPMSVEDLRILKETGLGTFQVFQETYHHGTYAAVHPARTPKSDYLWRLTAMHRAMEAGIDDVGIGVLFGLYDWRFDVMGLIAHAHELEQCFGIGPHTISFPRIEPAQNAPLTMMPQHKVDDDTLRKIVIILRLAVPHAGMILTARERADLREKLIPLGITQTDASPCIGIGGYHNGETIQKEDRQQFVLGDTRSLDDVVRALAAQGMITSFCTAGYRCGRTGECIMDLLRSGAEGMFCKLNAVLTYREWLDDFASDETRAVGEKILAQEMADVKRKYPDMYPQLSAHYSRVAAGERDVYF